jgi:putative serine protease PepD
MDDDQTGTTHEHQSSTTALPPVPPPPSVEPERPSPSPPQRRRTPLLLAGVALGAIVGGAAGAGVATIFNDDETTAPATRSNLDTESSRNSSNQQTAAKSDVQQVAEKVLPSVVSISVRNSFGEATGTGVIISSDGEILTNNHVVEGTGQGGDVVVTFSDGSTAQAEVVGTDPLTDLAVVKASDVSNLQPADLGSSSDLSVGQQVVAIGSPLGLEGTVTSGIVSALDRPVVAGQQEGGGTNSIISAIQTDAPINPGNSGGPLVDMDGKVVGINSAIATMGNGSGSIGLGFSIPIDQAKPIVRELLDGHEATHAQIGIGVGDTRDRTSGALITSVNNGSAGDKAGLQEGDVVTKVDSRVVTDATSLIAAVRSHRPGDEVMLTYERDGSEHTAQLTLGSDANGSS